MNRTEIDSSEQNNSDLTVFFYVNFRFQIRRHISHGSTKLLMAILLLRGQDAVYRVSTKAVDLVMSHRNRGGFMCNFSYSTE